MPRNSEVDKAPSSSAGAENIEQPPVGGGPADVFMCDQARRTWRNLPVERRDEAVPVLAACGSPIEQILLLALFDRLLGDEDEPPVNLMKGDDPAVWGAIFTNETRVHVIAQWKFGPYRLDFLVHGHREGKNTFIAVECDGHEFHERTPEQAAKDKERDIYLQLQGLKIARFTGTAITRDPWGCASTVVRLMCSTLYP